MQLFGNIQNLLGKDPSIMPTLVGSVSPIVPNYVCMIRSGAASRWVSGSNSDPVV